MTFEYNDGLFNLLELAKKDKSVVAKILATTTSKDPMSALCQLSTHLGYPVTVGDIMECGEEFLCNLSDGRMGVTEPMEEFGDIYGQFIASIEGLSEK